MLYNNKEVSHVILAPEAAQPEGAAGDNRVVMICFEDNSLAVNTTIASLKAQSTALDHQISESTGRKQEVDGVLSQTVSL